MIEPASVLTHYLAASFGALVGFAVACFCSAAKR